jgi:hypothetical protein
VVCVAFFKHSGILEKKKVEKKNCQKSKPNYMFENFFVEFKFCVGEIQRLEKKCNVYDS